MNMGIWGKYYNNRQDLLQVLFPPVYSSRRIQLARNALTEKRFPYATKNVTSVVRDKI